MNKIQKAFYSDCKILIENFVKYDSMQFGNFCHEWKRMHFANIYATLNNDSDVAQLTTELILGVKKILVNEQRPHLERLCGLYMLYAFYFKQPLEEFIKIKMTCDDWKSMKALLKWIDSQEDAIQAKTIFWKLFTADAFRFVYNDINYGFENFHERQEGMQPIQLLKTEDIFGKVVKEVQHESTGLLSAFENLEEGYNEMKELMNRQSTCSQSLAHTNIFNDLKRNFNKIEEIIMPERNITAASESEAGCSSRSSIHARRAKLKKKAFTKTVQNQVQGEKENYEISLQGDFIQIIRESNVTNSINRRTGLDVLSKQLPEEVYTLASNTQDTTCS